MENFVNLIGIIVGTVVFFTLMQKGYALVNLFDTKYCFLGKILGFCIVGIIFKIYFYLTDDF